MAGPRAELAAKRAEKLMAPKADPVKDWHAYVDHGPAFVQTFMDYYERDPRSGAAIKGILLTGEDADRVALFDTETLRLVTATSKGISLDNTPWAGYHGTENKVLNDKRFLFNSASRPGWANVDGSFSDPRKIKGYGNLPYGKFLGYYLNGTRTILEYEIHGTHILENVEYGEKNLERTLQIGPRKAPLKIYLADDEHGWTISDGHAASAERVNYRHTIVETRYGQAVMEKGPTEKSLVASIPASDVQTTLILSYSKQRRPNQTLGEMTFVTEPELDSLTKGGEAPETFTTQPQMGDDSQPWAVDAVPLPPRLQDSPYRSEVRVSDVDLFLGGDKAVLTTWGGDVWTVSGLNEFKEFTWKRFATGTFEPLGVKVVDGIVHINARDGIYQLIDLNDDGECDHYKVFNRDVFMTANFHEFTFGLEMDKEGNFYFSKASPVVSGGRGFDRILPHNGTIMKVTADGSELSVLATGLRAPGGIGVGPNGELTTGENEGTWQPACKVNFMKPDTGRKFFGTEQAAQDLKGAELHDPLLYLPMSWDNSGASQEWVPDFAKIGMPEGAMLHMSYGQSSIYRVFPQEVNGKLQAAAAKLPVQLGSSAQRAVFHPDGSMYVCGFRGWQTNGPQIAALQRIRRTEAFNSMPVNLVTTSKGIDITFDVALDDELAVDTSSFTIERWDYVRSEQYGSGHFSVDALDTEARKKATTSESKKHRVHDSVKVLTATLSQDAKTISLTLDGHKACHQLHLAYDLETDNGDELIGETVQTIYNIPVN